MLLPCSACIGSSQIFSDSCVLYSSAVLSSTLSLCQHNFSLSGSHLAIGLKCVEDFDNEQKSDEA